MNVATKTGPDEDPRSARCVTQFVIRSATTSRKYTPSDTRVYGIIAFETDKSLERPCGKPTSAQRLLERCYAMLIHSHIFPLLALHLPLLLTDHFGVTPPINPHVIDSMVPFNKKTKTKTALYRYLPPPFALLFIISGIRPSFLHLLRVFSYLLLGCGRSRPVDTVSV